MPINPLGGWTAASLTPNIAPRPSDPSLSTRNVSSPITAVSNATNTLSDPLIGNFLQSIYGNGWQSLLGTQDRSVQPNAPAPPDPALIEANAYAANLAAKTNAISAYGNYQNNMIRAQQNLARANPNNFNSYSAAQNATIDMGQGQAIGQISQAAALSPSYAPAVRQSLGQQAPGQGPSWNPYGMSGWVSPVASGYNMPSTGSMAQNLMSMGA